MQKNTEAKPHHGLAIAGLILNILVLPGLGTLIGGETKKHDVWTISFNFYMLLYIYEA